MSSPLLVVRENKIVRADDPEEKEVLLRGAGLGGWMNMENVSFSTGLRDHAHSCGSSLQATPDMSVGHLEEAKQSVLMRRRRRDA